MWELEDKEGSAKELMLTSPCLLWKENSDKETEGTEESKGFIRQVEYMQKEAEANADRAVRVVPFGS